MSKEDVAAEAAPAAKAPYWDPPPAPLLDTSELTKWSLYRALIAEFVATLIFLYVSVATVIGYKSQSSTEACTGVGYLGVAWAFGATIFVLVYCTGGVSGGHINPAVTFGLFVGRKLSLVRTVLYIVAQCLGAICGVGIVKGIMKHPYDSLGGRRVLARGRARRRDRRHVHPRLHRLLRHRPQAHRAGLLHSCAGAAADWVRGVRGALGNNTNHRHGHQPGEEPWRRRPLQPAQSMERPLDLLGWAADRGIRGGGVPQARAARGGRQGARLVQGHHQRDGVSCWGPAWQAKCLGNLSLISPCSNSFAYQFVPAGTLCSII